MLLTEKRWKYFVFLDEVFMNLLVRQNIFNNTCRNTLSYWTSNHRAYVPFWFTNNMLITNQWKPNLLYTCSMSSLAKEIHITHNSQRINKLLFNNSNINGVLSGDRAEEASRNILKFNRNDTFSEYNNQKQWKETRINTSVLKTTSTLPSACTPLFCPTPNNRPLANPDRCCKLPNLLPRF